MRRTPSGLLVADDVSPTPMRGHGKVELLDERGKRVLERIDFENFIANPGKDWLRWKTRKAMTENHPSSSSPFTTYAYYSSAYGGSSEYANVTDPPLVPDVFSYLNCHNYTAVEDPANERHIMAPYPVAWAYTGGIGSGDATREGAVNRLESELYPTHSKLVFDWATSAGNGTFRSLSWSPAVGAQFVMMQGTDMTYNKATGPTGLQTDLATYPNSNFGRTKIMTPDGSGVWTTGGVNGAWKARRHDLPSGLFSSGVPAIDLSAVHNHPAKGWELVGGNDTYLWFVFYYEADNYYRRLYRFRVSDGGLDNTFDLFGLDPDINNLYGDHRMLYVNAAGTRGIFYAEKTGSVGSRYVVFNPLTGSLLCVFSTSTLEYQTWWPLIDEGDASKLIMAYYYNPNTNFENIANNFSMPLPVAGGSMAAPVMISASSVEWYLSAPFNSSNSYRQAPSAPRRWFSSYSDAGIYWLGEDSGLGARTRLAASVTKTNLQTMKITYQFDYV